jgi:hypothetical protein
VTQNAAIEIYANLRAMWHGFVVSPRVHIPNALNKWNAVKNPMAGQDRNF